MSQSTPNEFLEAQARGDLHAMPERPDIVKSEAPAEVVIDNPEEFRRAVGMAQMSRKADAHVVVSEALFSFLSGNQKTRYMTYGSPGVRVFKPGDRESVLDIERMTHEEYAQYVSRQKAAGRQP